jgi:hypothetical protein
MKKSALAKQASLGKKGAFSSTLYEPKSGANKRSSAKKNVMLLKAQITGGKTKLSRKFLMGKDVNKAMQVKKIKKEINKRNVLKYGKQ